MNTDKYLIELASDSLDRTWKEGIAIYGRKIGKAPNIIINGRLKVVCGRAFLDRGYIDLSRKLFTEYTPGFLRNIVPHEAAHFIAWRCFKDDGHGRDWKMIMRALGQEPLLRYTFDKPEDKA